MKPRCSGLMFWWTMYWLSVAVLEWILSAHILIASRQSSFAIFAWFFPVVLIPFITINTAIILRNESAGVRQFLLMSKVSMFLIIAALIASNFFPLVPELLIALISVGLLLWMCFWENKKLRAMREAGNSNHAV